MADRFTKIPNINRTLANDSAINLRESVKLKGSTAPAKANPFIQSQAASSQTLTPVAPTGPKQK